MSASAATETTGTPTSSTTADSGGAEAARADAALPPFAAVVVRVEAVERVSPNFVRVTLGGEELRGVGNPDRTLDQRIKLVFPPASGALARIPSDASDWYAAWLAIPEELRGTMRTYSIRRIELESDGTTRLVIDFVLHLAEGATGPASLWASGAAPGDELLVVAPRRGRHDAGGIEFAPGGAERIVLAGDETAAPAIARIIEELPGHAIGTAFIEVPCAEDRLGIVAPAGVDVRWLPREGAEHGTALIPEVLAHVGERVLPPIVDDPDAEALVWETPLYSSAEAGTAGDGGSEEPAATAPDPHDEYFWIAGESGVVTTLRRHLVRDHGIARTQVAFMGYWRRGVAMKG